MKNITMTVVSTLGLLLSSPAVLAETYYQDTSNTGLIDNQWDFPDTEASVNSDVQASDATAPEIIEPLSSEEYVQATVPYDIANTDSYEPTPVTYYGSETPQYAPLEVSANYSGQQYEQAVSSSSFQVQAPEPAPELGVSLVSAVQSGNALEVKRLLSRGANPMHKDLYSKKTALDLAMDMGSVKMARAFHERGANLVEGHQDSTTYLHVAAAHGKLELAQYLVSIGLSPNAKTSKDWTPLHHAARFGHADVVQYLLEQSADPQGRTVEGKTPRDLAVRMAHFHVAALFN